MHISKIIPESLKNYSGEVSSVIFFSSCNYNCSTCYAKEIVYNAEDEIIDPSEVLRYLKNKKKWLDGVVLCGGEPTMEIGIINFAKQIKDLGYKIKLDTNGRNYRVLEALKEENLIDYAAMDAKAPPYLYKKITNSSCIDYIEDIEKGIKIIASFPDYEFRTTIVPLSEAGKHRWMNPYEVGDTARMIKEATGTDNHKYFLQKFQAKEKYEMLDERFARENLQKEFHETPINHLENCLESAKKYLPNAKIR